VAAQFPDEVKRLRDWYEAWWSELSPTFSQTSKIVIGSPEVPRVRLTALQWIDTGPVWNQGIVRKANLKSKKAKGNKTGPAGWSGHWLVQVAESGTYLFELRRWPEEAGLALRQGTPPHPVRPGLLPSFSAVKGTALNIVSGTLRIDGVDLG